MGPGSTDFQFFGVAEFLIEKSPYYAERFSRTAKDNGNYLRKQELKDWGNTPVLQNLRNSVIYVSP